MKFKITIEETVSAEFEIEAADMEAAMEEAERQYNAGEIVVIPECVTSKQMQGWCEETDEMTEWTEF